MKKKINLNRYTTIYLLIEKRILKKNIKKYRKVGKFKEVKHKERAVYAKKTKTFIKSEKQQKRFYRYSIAYFYVKYRKTFRAEIYTDQPINEEWARKSLILSLKDWVNKHPPAVQAMFNNSSYVGFETDEVGINDIGQSELNRIRCNLE